ncbi:hypothetical protein KPH14_006641 [Odynerus spinipes]|uniref:Cilia- and flagella-associated protein 61 N-terminal domain-containing protein n=1 Tax=Odynerus spinipes TaxID=1348599 RepID=A0AAD9RRZ8_9HYME|nr:hypothetical protein KPH14_006641 [Odynerus spinipes]
MTRHPDDRRRLIVSEDDNGFATGTMCLNSTIDLDVLDENFELTVYGGLRKIRESDQSFGKFQEIGSEVLSVTYIDESSQDTLVDNNHYEFFSVHSQQSVEQEQRHSSHQARSSLRKTSLKKDKSYRESKDDNDYEVSLKSTKNSESNRILPDGLSDINDSNTDTIPLPTSRMGLMFTAKFVESDLSTGMQTVLPVFIYRGEVNAFVIEIFTMREDIGNRGTREFLEAAFESYPDLDYCTLLVPSAYQYFSLLEHFTRVPLRYNKDFPMSLYLAHKAALFGKISCREADSSDEAAILRFLGDVPKRNEIMRDFVRAMNRSANSFFSCTFECDDVIIGLAIVRYPQNFIHFTNITLISPNGLPYEKKRDGLKWEMIPFRGRYCRDYRRHLIAGRAWINVVRGTVVLIKRNEKYVVVTDHNNLSYDFLILTCGLQYQKTLFDEEETGIMKRGDVKSENIWNCLTINDDTEAFISLEKVRLITNDFKEKKAIVFYGHNIDCYCALYGLIKHGVPAISCAGLVFNNRLLISPEFRTNDPFVFAAGTVTKYARKFDDQFCDHKYYNSIEIGERDCHADSLLEDSVRVLLKNEGKGISIEDRELIAKKYVGSVYQQEVENSVVDFLQFSEQALPDYCTPRLMRWMYADIESSPLFFEQ